MQCVGGEGNHTFNLKIYSRFIWIYYFFDCEYNFGKCERFFKL